MSRARVFGFIALLALLYKRKYLWTLFRYLKNKYFRYKPEKHLVRKLELLPLRIKHKTFQHYPLIPKNPAFKNHFIRGSILSRRGGLEHGITLFDKDQMILFGFVKIGHKVDGHKGIVHGGLTAALFDDFMGELIGSTFGKSFNAFTAYLKVDYRKPMPSGQVVLFANKITKIDGKKVYIHSQAFEAESDVVHGDPAGLFSEFVGTRTLYSEAESLYIVKSQ